MAQDHRLNLDPFTIDLFNNTALSSTFSLGVTAFAAGRLLVARGWVS